MIAAILSWELLLGYLLGTSITTAYQCKDINHTVVVRVFRDNHIRSYQIVSDQMISER